MIDVVGEVEMKVCACYHVWLIVSRSCQRPLQLLFLLISHWLFVSMYYRFIFYFYTGNFCCSSSNVFLKSFRRILFCYCLITIQTTVWKTFKFISHVQFKANMWIFLYVFAIPWRLIKEFFIPHNFSYIE